MSQIFFMFVTAFVLSLILTPLARWLGTRLKAFDYPTDRKIHVRPIPRTGGLAIIISVILTNIIFSFIYPEKRLLFVMHSQLSILALGFIFISCWFLDDFKR